MQLRLLSLSLLSLFSITILAQSSNMTVVGTWKDVTIPKNNNNQTYNDCWGWEQNGREYAVIGSRIGSHIIDVTNPASPVEVDRVIGNYTGSNVIHRDYKVHKGHLYMVGDQGSSTLQIADLSYLPDSVHVVYDNNSLVVKSHNIFVDSAHDILYSCGGSKLTGDNDLRLFDISSPANPVLLKDCKDDFAWWSGSIGYVHDIYVENNIAYTHDLDAMHIVDFTNINSPVVLGSLSSYPDQGINHSGWLHADDTTYVMLDETHGKRLKFMDVANPSSITVTDLEGPNTSSTAIAHNGFIKGDLCYVSYYYDGVYVFDVSDRNNVTIAGFYDTYQGPDGSGFHGCWGVYPYLPSGNIIASDLETGLYVMSLNTSPTPTANFTGSPTTVCAGDQVTFNNTSISGASYQWSFQGGTPATSTLQNPTVTYSTSGTYDVTLIATNSFGSDTLIKTAYINVLQGPCLTLPPGGNAPTQTTCQGTLFDDGGPGGIYTRNQDTYVLIQPTGATSVDVSFPFFDIESGAGSSAPPCGYDYIELYDGTSVAAPLIGRYCNGNIPPSTVSSSGGAMYVKFHTDPGAHLQGFQLDWTCVTSNPPPVANFSGSPTTLCEGDTVVYSDQSTGSPTSWSWSFPGGTPSSSTLQNPSVVYNTAGNYDAKLVVTNGGGSDSLTQTSYITVNVCGGGQPSINFTAAANTVGENVGAQQIDVSLSATYTSAVFVQVDLDVSSTATNSVDYTTPSPFPITLVFPPNTTAPQSVFVNVVDDAVSESSETVKLILQNPVNGVLGTTTQHTLTIDDNDVIGINELAKGKIILYPNPVKVGETVSLGFKTDVSVFDVSGQMVYDGLNISSFSTSNMQAGCYFIKTTKGMAKLMVE